MRQLLQTEIDKVINHRQARDDLDFYVKSVASGMVPFKRFCAVVKARVTNFFHKNFFLPHV